MVTAITNELLRSCIQLDVGSVERLGERKRVMPLKKVTHLVFSFRDLRAIDHLEGLTFLEKLHLDNNSIYKIENMSHLVNLTVLDISFNKIEKIEGLESLKNLDDLSLYCNQIKHLEGLDALQKLTSLSLGKNLLQSLEEILYLRRLKSLQLLTLDGNPLCKVFLEIQNDPSLGEHKLQHLLEDNEKLKDKLLELEMLSVGEIQEDQTLSNEERMHKAINQTFQEEEIKRNRERVEEILFVVTTSEIEINDKLSDYVESP